METLKAKESTGTLRERTLQSLTDLRRALIEKGGDLSKKPQIKDKINAAIANFQFIQGKISPIVRDFSIKNQGEELNITNVMGMRIYYISGKLRREDEGKPTYSWSSAPVKGPDKNVPLVEVKDLVKSCAERREADPCIVSLANMPKDKILKKFEGYLQKGRKK